MILFEHNYEVSFQVNEDSHSLQEVLLSQEIQYRGQLPQSESD